MDLSLPLFGLTLCSHSSFVPLLLSLVLFHFISASTLPFSAYSFPWPLILLPCLPLLFLFSSCCLSPYAILYPSFISFLPLLSLAPPIPSLIPYLFISASTFPSLSTVISFLLPLSLCLLFPRSPFLSLALSLSSYPILVFFHFFSTTFHLSPYPFLPRPPHPLISFFPCSVST